MLFPPAKFNLQSFSSRAFQSFVCKHILSKSKALRAFMNCFQHIGAQLVIRFIDGQVQLIKAVIYIISC